MTGMHKLLEISCLAAAAYVVEAQMCVRPLMPSQLVTMPLAGVTTGRDVTLTVTNTVDTTGNTAS
jgi:hypothetical protein